MLEVMAYIFKIVAVLSICFAVAFGSYADQIKSISEILEGLTANASKLEDVKITARETNIIFNDYSPVSRLLNSRSSFSNEELKKLKTFANSNTGITTNIKTCIYQFGEDTLLINILGVDKQTGEAGAKTFVTTTNVFMSRTFLGRDGNTNITEIGEIYNKTSNVGLPHFFNKFILAQWITNSDEVSYTTGKSLHGYDSYIITFTPPTKSPVANYKLFIRLVDMEPVELDSYFSDGKPYSISELEFQNHDHPTICKRAATRIFSGEHVFREIFWEVAKIEKTPPTMAENIDSFFSEGALVSDKRFSKPIIYTQGRRLPNDSEIKEILKSPRGVVKYQLATHSDRGLAIIAATRAKLISEANNPVRVVIRVVIFIVFLLPPVLFIFIAFKNRRIK
ncbi:MAG TPA: hypothetical protein VFM25_02745 [Verrucomicrobiae bacterium]|nr:hypothetical protein [Verrucomicrobiae bacterium]